MRYLFFAILISFNLFAANTKISELNTLTATGLATADLLAIVDTSTAETKSISIGELNKFYYSASLSTTATFNTELTVTSTTYLQSGLILKSPDGTCSNCSVDNSDNFTCASITCP